MTPATLCDEAQLPVKYFVNYMKFLTGTEGEVRMLLAVLPTRPEPLG
jgi:hypothetical protein